MLVHTDHLRVYTWSAKKWTILFKFQSWRLFNKILNFWNSQTSTHFFSLQPQKNTTAMFLHSLWSHLLPFTDLTNIFWIPTPFQALLSHRPPISEAETNKQPNSILHHWCINKKVESVTCTLRREERWSSMSEGWEWGQESGQDSKRI